MTERFTKLGSASQTEKPNVWIEYINKRIKNNQNFVCVVTGKTGSGKSYSCISIAEMLDPSFNASRICMSPLEFLQVINSDLPAGSVIILEEVGVNASNRNWQSQYNKALNMVLQTFRNKNYIVLANVPVFNFIDSQIQKLLHAHFEIMGINRVTNRTICKPFEMEYNGKANNGRGKFYNKYLREIQSNKYISKSVPVKKWAIPLPSEKIRRDYTDKEEAFKKQVITKALKEMQDMEQKEEQKVAGKKSLTPTQQEFVDLLKEGLNMPQIQERLHITSSSAYSRLSAIKNKGYIVNPIWFGVPPNTKVIKYEVS